MPEPPSPSTPHVAGSAFPAPAGQPNVDADQEHNGRNETRLERCDKEHLVVVANRFMIAGLAAVAVAIVGAIVLVTDLLYGGPLVVGASALASSACLSAWCLVPLRRRRMLRRARRA